MERSIEYANKECEIFVGYCDNILHKKLNHEPLNYIDDLDSPWGVNFDGVTIIANKDFTEFEVGHEVYDPGDYWNPPESDYAEYSKHERLHDALLDILILWLKFDHKNWTETQWVSECISEMDEGYE